MFPYVMALVNKGPNAENGKKVLDFVLSDESQAMWANAYLRPVFADRLSSEAQGQVPARRGVCPRQGGRLKSLAKAQPQIVERYRKEVN